MGNVFAGTTLTMHAITRYGQGLGGEIHAPKRFRWKAGYDAHKHGREFDGHAGARLTRPTGRRTSLREGAPYAGCLLFPPEHIAHFQM